MLVLTRKNNEGILIGDDIEITVVSIKGEKIQLGIKAPDKYIILRKELYEQVSMENQAAQAVDVNKLKGFKLP